ncbi:MAG: DUF2934 domain-containing protein [Candidatus Omnitrophota bacterium]
MAKTKTAVKRKMVSAKGQLSQEELNELIQRKAYELHEKRGYSQGSDLDDWLEAERIIKSVKY